MAKLLLEGGASVFTKDRWEEGIDYEETYALVARLEAIRMLLAYASIMDFKLYQMDVKSSFLNGFIQEGISIEV